MTCASQLAVTCTRQDANPYTSHIPPSASTRPRTTDSQRATADRPPRSVCPAAAMVPCAPAPHRHHPSRHSIRGMIWRDRLMRAAQGNGLQHTSSASIRAAQFGLDSGRARRKTCTVEDASENTAESLTTPAFKSLARSSRPVAIPTTAARSSYPGVALVSHRLPRRPRS